jgi:hypothetical protein
MHKNDIDDEQRIEICTIQWKSENILEFVGNKNAVYRDRTCDLEVNSLTL